MWWGSRSMRHKSLRGIFVNFKKIGTAAGVATAGVALFVATQGTAQATPAQPVAPISAAQPDKAQPMFIASAAKAVGKAATKGANKATAVGKGMAVVAKSNADQMLSNGAIFGYTTNVDEAADADTVFDR